MEYLSNLEDDPEEDEPELEPETPGLTPGRAGIASQDFEYRTENLDSVQVADGTTLAGRLNQAAEDGWSLVTLLPLGGTTVVLLRRHRRPGPSRRGPVGFVAAGSS